MRPEELRNLMESDARAVLIDVREEGEYDAGHIEGAFSIPLSRIVRCRSVEDALRAGFEVAALERGLKSPDEVVTYVLYCHSGARSARAVQHLRQVGLRKVENGGGIMLWPYPLVRS